MEFFVALIKINFFLLYRQYILDKKRVCAHLNEMIAMLMIIN